MRVLITGGTGFIETHLTCGALGRGWEMTLLTRNPDGGPARALALIGARLTLGDVTHRASLRTAPQVSKPQILFHNAGWYEAGIGRRERRRMWSVNVEGAENALAIMQAALAAPLLRLAGQPPFLSPESVRSSYASIAVATRRGVNWGPGSVRRKRRGGIRCRLKPSDSASR